MENTQGITEKPVIIETRIIQALARDKPPGFARHSKYYTSRIETSCANWYKTIDYCRSRGWIEDTGHRSKLGIIYRWCGK